MLQTLSPRFGGGGIAVLLAAYALRRLPCGAFQQVLPHCSGYDAVCSPAKNFPQRAERGACVERAAPIVRRSLPPAKTRPDGDASFEQSFRARDGARRGYWSRKVGGSRGRLFFALALVSITAPRVQDH